MSLSRVYLRVFSSNLRAVRCYEKAGFRKEGRLKRRSQSGQLEEILLMRILREEYLRRSVSPNEKRTA
jgi:RimJ/RimL family protein N-acetyltransferase